MKKILLTLLAISAYTNIAFGQVTVSLNDLVGTKWQFADEHGKHESDYYEFTKETLIWHRSDGSTSSYPYYLSSMIPTKFELAKVGVNKQGCYYTKYNQKMDYFYCYSIKSFSKSTGRMVCKVMNKDIIGLTDTFTFILMK